MEEKIKDKIVEINTSNTHLPGLLSLIAEQYCVEPKEIEYNRVGELEHCKITFIPVEPTITTELKLDDFTPDINNELDKAMKEPLFKMATNLDNMEDLDRSLTHTNPSPDTPPPLRHKCTSSFCETYIPAVNEYCTVCLKPTKPQPCTNNECVIKHNDDTDCKH